VTRCNLLRAGEEGKEKERTKGGFLNSEERGGKENGASISFAAQAGGSTEEEGKDPHRAKRCGKKRGVEKRSERLGGQAQTGSGKEGKDRH